MKKGIWITLLIVVAIITGIFTYLRVRKSNDFEPQIKAKLAKLVSDASNGLYKLDMEHIEIDITSSSVTAKNLMLLPDSLRMIELSNTKQLGNDVYTIFLKKLDLTGLSPLALLDKKNIDLGKLVLDSPEIKIVHKKRNVEKKDNGNLYDRITKDNQSFSIAGILLNNIKLTIVDLDKNKSTSSFKNLSAAFTDIKIDSSTKTDSTRFLFAKDAVIYMKGFSRATAKNKYSFNIDSLVLRPQHGILQLFNIRLKPIGTKDEFSAKLQHMDDMYDISIKKANVKNINWFSLLSEDGFYGDEMTIEDGFIKVYDDRRLPVIATKVGNFPHQMLMKVDMPLSIKKATLKNLFVSYEEFNPKAERTGTVVFQHLTGEIKNLTNIEAEIKVDPVATIKASADFMDAGKITALFKLNLAKADSGDFTVDASLGTMEGQNLNKITEGLGLIKIKSLVIDKLDAHVKGSNYSSSGRVLFAYHNLSFDVLKTNDEGELKKRGLLTFIADKIIVKNSSKGKEINVAYQRDPQRSFFNLIWKTILQGILKTVK